MSEKQSRIAKVQKKVEPAPHLEQEPTRQAERGSVQVVGPQAVYRRVRGKGGGLRSADLLALQRAVGNRRVQRLLSNTPALQRDTPPQGAQAEKRVDVALLLGDEAEALIEARTYAPIVIRATSGADAKKQLLALGKPIGTIFVVSHSTRAGEVQVISSIGTISWVKLSDFSADLKGLPSDKAPQSIDFRGCKLGEAPQQMETFRKNVGAQSARATNCWSIVRTASPLTMPDGTPITQESQIKGRETQFNKALRQQINNLKADNGRSVKDCIIGLAAGETAARNFAKIRQLYFQNAGNLAAGWASPEYNYEWQQDSICAKEMTATTKPCKIVTQTAPATGSGADKGAMRLDPVESLPLDYRWNPAEDEMVA